MSSTGQLTGALPGQSFEALNCSRSCAFFLLSPGITKEASRGWDGKIRADCIQSDAWRSALLERHQIHSGH